MKKYLMVILLFCSIASLSVMADVKKPQDMMLDFTLSYKAHGSDEHVMKNAVTLASKKWVVAGKLVSRNEQVLLFLVRMLSHKNNKYNLEFMLIDSGNADNYIAMPEVKAMTGLPVKVAQKDGENLVELNVLVRS